MISGKTFDPPVATPSISIVVPSYNQASFLKASIDSVLNQNYPNLELVLVDGGSTDGSVEIIEQYRRRFSWWCSESDGGQVRALNKGFAKTSGKIMGWLNSDDMYMPYTLAEVARFFSKHPEIDVIYGNRILIDADGAEIGRWILPPHENGLLSKADVVPQETVFWRRRIWDKIGGRLDEKFTFAMDWDMLVRFRDAGARMKRLPMFLGLFRIHDRQKSAPANKQIGDEEMQEIRRRCLGFEPSRLGLIVLTLRFFLWARIFEIVWKLRRKNFRG